MTTLDTRATPQHDADAPASPERALEALRWAGAVAESHARLGEPPATPGEDEWRAVPVDTLREHLDAILVVRGEGVEHGLEALHRVGFFRAWLPEIEAMVGMGDGEWRHKDVWKHTKQVVKQAVPRLTVRWGALLHDIGKPKTRKIDGKGRVTFYGHAELGAKMFRRKVARRLGFQGELKDRVHFLILYHLRPSQYDAGWTDAAVRRFYKQMGEGLTDLLDLGRADITTKRPAKRKRGVRNIADLKKRIDGIRAEDEKPKALPKGLGEAIMERFGIPPSKRLGDLMKALTAAVEDGELERQDDYESYLAFLAEHADRFGV
ncbi:MAG TPA: HDIG domain-containing protein [Polyangiaceae bacterium LLY-WYZ-15_(1-7)]|nr:metal-dependent phosphohydrolase [Myxococcales bacterium]MBJ71087.1 metal-dependent phosphohydrolase [Sandaracinus sp.]HJK92345.1 HDIG domain-containing protein [Polyangiaceae bacterium LLY-WYZ-15_(1-7)]HJL01176.1 HDIG domain-containing protein [Polyangiaceae bacterium LLY-WYZ-15_(1-7)]HJL10027.1 HDIG domain-containing protein [Polyangiaceae bacterium LLY-WYZ-15_(1-7)]